MQPTRKNFRYTVTHPLVCRKLHADLRWRDELLARELGHKGYAVRTPAPRILSVGRFTTRSQIEAMHATGDVIGWSGARGCLLAAQHGNPNAHPCRRAVRSAVFLSDPNHQEFPSRRTKSVPNLKGSHPREVSPSHQAFTSDGTYARDASTN
jgi:hypothetical protein